MNDWARSLALVPFSFIGGRVYLSTLTCHYILFLAWLFHLHDWQQHFVRTHQSVCTGCVIFTLWQTIPFAKRNFYGPHFVEMSMRHCSFNRRAEYNCCKAKKPRSWQNC